MLGFYNRSVILTYIGLIFGVVGIRLAMGGEILYALCCLMVCGVCDMFDGKIARATKRSEDAKVFGIQIDSLCDLVCFGVQPAVIAMCAGADGVVGTAVSALYVLAAVVRLGYFNVTEQKRQQQTDANRTRYQGLPVTTAAWLLPLFFCFSGLLGEALAPVLTAWMAVLAAAFVLDFRLPKPQKSGLLYAAAGILVAGAAAAVIFL